MAWHVNKIFIPIKRISGRRPAPSSCRTHGPYAGSWASGSQRVKFNPHGKQSPGPDRTCTINALIARCQSLVWMRPTAPVLGTAWHTVLGRSRPTSRSMRSSTRPLSHGKTGQHILAGPDASDARSGQRGGQSGRLHHKTATQHVPSNSLLPSTSPRTGPRPLPCGGL